MRIKDGYILRQFLDKWVAVDVHTQPDRPGMITMNKTGAFLWQQLQQPVTRQQLLEGLLQKYDVPEQIAAQELDMFLDMLRQKGILEETE